MHNSFGDVKQHRESEVSKYRMMIGLAATLSAKCWMNVHTPTFVEIARPGYTAVAFSWVTAETVRQY